MELKLKWEKPLDMIPSRDSDYIYRVDFDAIPETPGIYVFLRVFGDNYHPMYVGQAGDLKRRIIQQFNAVKLMRHVETAGNGPRRLAFAEFIPKPGQQAEKCINLIERALIRHFLSEGFELFNKQGTKIAKHEILSEVPPPKRQHFLPKQLFF
jgi:hypothetical protein